MRLLRLLVPLSPCPWGKVAFLPSNRGRYSLPGSGAVFARQLRLLRPEQIVAVGHSGVRALVNR